MKEIEVKAKVSDRESVEIELTKIGVALGEPIIQKDIVFAEDLDSFHKFIPHSKFMRIRTENGKNLLTFKKSEQSELSSLEFETEVSNAIETINIIKQLGFQEAVRVSKIRRKARYKDFEICFDEVEGLGSYIEVEKIQGDSADIVSTQEELFGFLMELGLSRSDQELHGYDTLVRMKERQ